MLQPYIDIDRVSIQLLSFVTTVVLGHVDCQEVEGPYCRGQSQCAVSRCVEAAAPAVSAAQDRGENRLRSETSARRHGGWVAALLSYTQGGSDGRGQQTASPMLTAIMSGGVGICGRELYKYR